MNGIEILNDFPPLHDSPPFSTFSCTGKPQRVEGKEYFTSLVQGVRYRPPAPAQCSLASLPSRAWPAARAPGSKTLLPAGHCFKIAQCLLNHSSTSGIILAVHCYPEVNSDCHILFYNTFLKPSFTSSALFIFFFNHLCLAECHFSLPANSILCGTREDVSMRL